MGQKVQPIGFRTGITRGWQSTWFAPKAYYGEFLVEDQKIRRYVDQKYNRQMPKGRGLPRRRITENFLLRTRKSASM
jgi:small subunit ribosomal protein S3